MRNLPSRFKYADKVIYACPYASNAEYGKKYDILDFDRENSKIKIEPGWYLTSSFSPYYNVKRGDTLMSRAALYLKGSHVRAGTKFKILSVSMGPAIQMIRIDATNLPHHHRNTYTVMPQHFKPLKNRTLNKKVKLI